MIGIFDSGVGGLTSFAEVRRLMPREDIIYLADRDNSPYGTKNTDELLRLVSKNISVLTSLGARAVLMACCTASTVFPLLEKELREISYPIIPSAAEYAASRGGRITVIATDYTASSHTFKEEILSHAPEASVTEISAQHLVTLVEGGARDGRLNGEERDFITGIADRVKESRPDVLVLGCTHFTHLKSELSTRLAGVEIIAPSILGARKFAEKYRTPYPVGRGRSVYL